MQSRIRLRGEHTHFNECVDDQALLAGFAIGCSIGGRHAGLRGDQALSRLPGIQ